MYDVLEVRAWVMESGVELQISYEEYKDFKISHLVGHRIMCFVVMRIIRLL